MSVLSENRKNDSEDAADGEILAVIRTHCLFYTRRSEKEMTCEMLDIIPASLVPSTQLASLPSFA